MIGRVATEKEVLIYQEAARPLTERITELLLRSGAYGFWQFQRALVQRSSPADQRNPSRINPEDVKAVMYSCGVLLTPDEHKSIVLAFSDSVGFVKRDPFFEAISPILRLPLDDASEIARLFPVDPVDDPSIPSHGNGSPSNGLLATADVTLPSVLGLFMGLFEPLPGDEERSINAALQVSYEEAAVTFTQEHYPKNRVAADEVMNFIASLMLLNGHCAGFLKTVLSRLSSSPALERAFEPVVQKTRQGKPIINTSGYSMVHKGLRWQRLFERYMNEDRRDEWLRGRDERDARGMYLKHTCGYAGHLPEFKRHFGRTFHVIEEDLPNLTVPKPVRAEPPPPDRFGTGRELRSSRNEHHYHLS